MMRMARIFKRWGDQDFQKMTMIRMTRMRKTMIILRWHDQDFHDNTMIRMTRRRQGHWPQWRWRFDPLARPGLLTRERRHSCGSWPPLAWRHQWWRHTAWLSVQMDDFFLDPRWFLTNLNKLWSLFPYVASLLVFYSTGRYPGMFHLKEEAVVERSLKRSEDIRKVRKGRKVKGRMNSKFTSIAMHSRTGDLL